MARIRRRAAAADGRLHGVRPHSRGGFLGRGRARALRGERGQFQRRQRLAHLLRPRDVRSRTGGLPPRERHAAGRHGPVDDRARGHGVDRGEQFGCDLCHRPGDLPGQGTHRGAHLAALHPLSERRQGLRHPALGPPHLHRRSAHVPHHGLHRHPPAVGQGIDRTDGPHRTLRLHQLLVLQQPDPGHRHRDGQIGRASCRERV